MFNKKKKIEKEIGSLQKEIEDLRKKEKEFKELSDQKKQKQKLKDTIKNIKEKKFDLEEIPKPEKEIDTLKHKRRWGKRIWNKFRRNRNPELVVGINMELLNGSHITFMVLQKPDGFKYKGRRYLFDNDSKYYNASCKEYFFDYHESYTLPVKRHIPMTNIIKTLKSVNLNQIEYSSNPSTLERFITSKIAEGIMRGQQLDEFLKKVFVVLIICAFASLLHLILFMHKTGMLNQITGSLGF